MTPEERARHIVDEIGGKPWRYAAPELAAKAEALIASAIREAVAECETAQRKLRKDLSAVNTRVAVRAIRGARVEEREACAKVAEGIPVQRRLGRILAAMIAAQIRARGEGG